MMILRWNNHSLILNNGDPFYDFDLNFLDENQCTTQDNYKAEPLDNSPERLYNIYGQTIDEVNNDLFGPCDDRQNVNGPIAIATQLELDGGPECDQNFVDKYAILIEDIPDYIEEGAASSEFCTYRLCEQRRFRRAYASAQSRQNLRCLLIQAVSQEEPSNRKPDPWPL